MFDIQKMLKFFNRYGYIAIHSLLLIHAWVEANSELDSMDNEMKTLLTKLVDLKLKPIWDELELISSVMENLETKIDRISSKVQNTSNWMTSVEKDVKEVERQEELSRLDLFNLTDTIALIKPWLSNPPRRNVIQVKTTQDLHQTLHSALPGDIIKLVNGLYIGEFKLSQDSVAIYGIGEETALRLNAGGKYQAALTVSGNNCEVSGLKVFTEEANTRGIFVKGSGNIFTNVWLDGFSTGVLDIGGDNSYGEISVKNGNYGAYIDANRDQLEEIRMENIEHSGVTFRGNINKVYKFKCTSCARGVNIDGSGNRVRYADIRMGNRYMYRGIEISGNGNFVGDSVCYGPNWNSGLLNLTINQKC